ncbi:hypothetical protein [Acinetobacter junii]|uniref:hypothetical protein n=1 Tax=Acinetobacter junii TaxID=40215 RepID=UPI001D18440C|nr:hypothetical protein [Acinetobacter junii]
MDISEKQAVWREQKPLFEAEFIHSHLLPFFNFNENTGDYEIKSECVNNTDDEDRKVAYEALNTGWVMWLRAKRDAKAQAVPEGFVLVPVKEIKEWYLDDSESIYREDPDWLCDISIGEVVEVEHRVSYELDQDPVFAAIQWDEENGDVGYYETFKSKAEAEKVAAHCKAMLEAARGGNE